MPAFIPHTPTMPFVRPFCLALAAAALCMAAPARAALDVYSPVPSSHWAYRSVRLLEQSGLAAGSPAGSFSGREELTRYDFATAVERLYREIQPRVLAAGDPGSLRDEIESLLKLIDEFAADLQTQGEDVSAMRGQLHLLSQRLTALDAAPASESQRSGSTRLSALLRSRLSARTQTAGRSRPVSLRPASAASVATASLGPGTLEVVAAPPATDERLPFRAAAELVDYRAQLSGQLAGSLGFSAFLEQDALFSDRDDPWDPLGMLGGASGAGIGLTTPIVSKNLQLQLEGASYRALQDDLQNRMSYFRGSLRVRMNDSLRVIMGAQLSRYTGGGSTPFDLKTYSLGLEQQLGRNSHLGLILRYSGAAGRSSTPAAADPGGSAITQFSVKF